MKMAADRRTVDERGDGSQREQGTQTPAEGADSSLKLATLPDDGPTGGLFDRHGRLPW